VDKPQYPDQEIRVRDLPLLTARSTPASDVPATSIEIVFNDKEVCCGKNFSLEDSVQESNPKSLKDIASKLQGKHRLSDGDAPKACASRRRFRSTSFSAWARLAPPVLTGWAPLRTHSVL